MDLADVHDLAVTLPLWQRVQHAVRSGTLPIAELADRLDAKPDSIEKAIKRKANLFAFDPE